MKFFTANIQFTCPNLQAHPPASCSPNEETHSRTKTPLGSSYKNRNGTYKHTTIYGRSNRPLKLPSTLRSLMSSFSITVIHEEYSS